MPPNLVSADCDLQSRDVLLGSPFGLCLMCKVWGSDNRLCSVGLVSVAQWEVVSALYVFPLVSDLRSVLKFDSISSVHFRQVFLRISFFKVGRLMADHVARGGLITLVGHEYVGMCIVVGNKWNEHARICLIDGSAHTALSVRVPSLDALGDSPSLRPALHSAE